MDIPKPVGDKLQAMLGKDYDKYLESFSHSYGQTLRINRLKVKPADLIRRFLLGKRVPWCQEGFYYEGEERLSTSPYYYGGAYYLQEPSAMAPAAFLPVKEGDRLLDLCAAPGGKTTALAGKLGDSGLLLANDISASRCKALLKNVELEGLGRCVITCESPERLSKRFRNYFDGVLVDAPCSGEGMFRKEPAMMKDWSPQSVYNYSRLQKEILARAVEMVKPGGYLLYSTCTFSWEEDEGAVSWLLAEYPDLRLMPLPLYPGIEEGRPERPGNMNREDSSDQAGTDGQDQPGSAAKTDQPDHVAARAGNPMRHCRRFWPHRLDGEGQFAALLQKTGPDLEDFSRIGKEKAGSDLDDFSQIGKEKEGSDLEDLSRIGKEKAGSDLDNLSRIGKEKEKSGTRKEQPLRLAAGRGKIVRDRSGKGRKNGGRPGRRPGKGSGKIETFSLEPAEKFLEEVRPCKKGEDFWLSWKERLEIREERLFLLPPGCPDFGGLRVVRSGLYLGDCHRGRFEPSQALAMVLRPGDYPRTLCLAEEDPRLDRYLKGETIEWSGQDLTESSAYVLVCFENLALGWGKLDRGRIKNKYLPGWRKM